ncbi:hypothetical protein ACT4VJ_16365 [Acinetobacter baumannii]|uniref:Bacteriophage protein n=1 Tax=Acinetobacter pittii TaxID=48296 RepID=A0AB33BKZ9_ACIPI|nr:MULTISPECIES: hypothetical protein [Acinetobacter calcoaceticus/baumannii complex]AMX20341.1 hypothetical protein IEC338SC_3230 [Acinetobacter pittii]MDC4815492.1 hypothetical protein [Acinetobacter baumannii]MDH2667219.1 hypothetical protein [Acinetobacter baumannii]OTR99602.1 hypothetical protein CAT26_08710 [Acinetobacter pittii]RDF74932.1 hypothetical protein DWA08_11925 [Acinetobacter baumannii]
MRYRKLDENGDYSFGQGQNNFHINTPEGVAQAVMTRLKFWVGEWFADTSDGTGWTTDVLGKYTDHLFELMIRQRILETQGVLRIDSFDSQFNGETRTLSIQSSITTIYGPADLQGDI